MAILRKTLLVFVIGLSALVTGAAPAQDGPVPAFAINWYTVDGGGGASSGGTFQLVGTIGQSDASPVAQTGGPFSFSGGFWGAGGVDFLFKDGFENLVLPP